MLDEVHGHDRHEHQVRKAEEKKVALENPKAPIPQNPAEAACRGVRRGAVFGVAALATHLDAAQQQQAEQAHHTAQRHNHPIGLQLVFNAEIQNQTHQKGGGDRQKHEPRADVPDDPRPVRGRIVGALNAAHRRQRERIEKHVETDQNEVRLEVAGEGDRQQARVRQQCRNDHVGQLGSAAHQGRDKHGSHHAQPEGARQRGDLGHRGAQAAGGDRVQQLDHAEPRAAEQLRPPVVEVHWPSGDGNA